MAKLRIIYHLTKGKKKKKLNKNNRFNRFKVFALTVAKYALLFAVSFAVEQFVANLLVGLDLAVVEFALNELGNTLAIKVLLKLFLLANFSFGKRKKSKKKRL